MTLPSPDQSTIVGPATASWPAGVAIVRLSGPAAWSIVQQLSGQHAPPPGVMTLRALRDPSDGALLDRGLVVAFAGPRSFTGQDVAELHVHGSPAGVERLIAVCVALGARLAEPGEFTWRAYQAGKLDLLQVEALGDLLAAQSELQHRAALELLDGELSRRVATLRAPLLTLVAEIEARLDFAAEPHLATLDPVPMLAQIAELRRQLQELAGTARAGQVRHRGARVVLFGAPNAGKSTLLNALVELDRALVDPRPGTTRDTLEVQTAPQGVLVTWIDTAGVRETDDPVERAGTQRALAEVDRADLVLWCVDGSAPPGRATPGPRHALVLGVATKADLGVPQLPGLFGDTSSVAVAAATGVGVAELRARVVGEVRRLAQGPRGAQVAISRARHAHALQAADVGLSRAWTALRDGAPLELVAADLRDAVAELYELTGALVPDDVLGEIFANFCIGK